MPTNVYQAPRVAPFRAILADRPARVEPPRKIYRVGTTYSYRDTWESLPAAAAAFLTSHYRIRHGVVQRFAVWHLIEALHQMRDQWTTLRDMLAGQGVPFEGYQERTRPPFQALTVVEHGDLDEVAQFIAIYGPVLALLPWPDRFESISSAWSELWIGPDKMRLMPPYDSVSFRGVLLKGVSYRYGALRVQDERPDRPDAWLPFHAMDALLMRGGKVMSAIY